MTIKYREINDVLAEAQLRCPDFSMFSEGGNIIKIMHWQPSGGLSFSEDKGFSCETEEHKRKAADYIKLAKKERADIVLTPEYSFPWITLKDIISNSEKWPYVGKLWCLGMEGISFESLYEYCHDSHSEIVNILVEDLDEISPNKFVSCIAYVFRIGRDKLVCLFQLKTTAAADPWGQLEASGLTLGNTIYYFCAESHIVVTYICADALNQSISVIKSNINYQQCIILHPQLNPKPMHDSFRQMRKSFMDYGEDNVRIISVNWSKGTLLSPKEGRSEIMVQDSYSACYFNRKLQNEEVTQLINNNTPKGLGMLKDDYIYIWHMPSNEHCMQYSIDSFSNQQLHSTTAIHKEPLANIYWEYNTNKNTWERNTGCRICAVDWEWLSQVFQLRQCDESECEVAKLHMFFAILFGRKLYDGLSINEGIGQAVFERNDEKSIETVRLRESSEYVNKALSQGKIPPKYSYLCEGNYQWILDNKGNLMEKGNSEKRPINVLFVDSEKVVDRGIAAFQRLMGEEAKDRLMIYYMSYEGICYYDKLYNTEINNPELTHPVDRCN